MSERGVRRFLRLFRFGEDHLLHRLHHLLHDLLHCLLLVEIRLPVLVLLLPTALPLLGGLKEDVVDALLLGPLYVVLVIEVGPLGGGLGRIPVAVCSIGIGVKMIGVIFLIVVALILVTVPCGQSTFSLHIAFTHGWSLILAFF